MTNLTIIHYDQFTFELSYEVEGQFFEDVFISIDTTDNVIEGLPKHLEDYEDTIWAELEADYGDIIDENVEVALNDYLEYVESAKCVW